MALGVEGGRGQREGGGWRRRRKQRMVMVVEGGGDVHSGWGKGKGRGEEERGRKRGDVAAMQAAVAAEVGGGGKLRTFCPNT